MNPSPTFDPCIRAHDDSQGSQSFTIYYIVSCVESVAAFSQGTPGFDACGQVSRVSFPWLGPERSRVPVGAGAGGGEPCMCALNRVQEPKRQPRPGTMAGRERREWAAGHRDPLHIVLLPTDIWGMVGGWSRRSGLDGCSRVEVMEMRGPGSLRGDGRRGGAQYEKKRERWSGSNHDSGLNNRRGIYSRLAGDSLTNSQKVSHPLLCGGGGLCSESCWPARTRPDTGAEPFIISPSQTPALFPCWTALFAHSRPDVSSLTGHSRLPWLA